MQLGAHDPRPLYGLVNPAIGEVNSRIFGIGN